MYIPCSSANELLFSPPDRFILSRKPPEPTAVMGKITLFTKEACPASVKVNGLLVERAEAANVTEISVSASPGWTDPLFLLARGEYGFSQNISLYPLLWILL